MMDGSADALLPAPGSVNASGAGGAPPQGYVAKRRILTALFTMGLAVVYMCRVNLSVALEPLGDEYHYDGSTKGRVLSAFYVGYMPCQVLGSSLSERYGGKLIFGLSIGMTSVLTCLLPYCAQHLWLLYTVRILMGLFESFSYPSMYFMFQHWAPKHERASIVGACTSGAYAGTAVAFPLAGWLIKSEGGWPTVFYVFGAIGFVWLFFWWLLVTSTPDEHPTIHASELALLHETVEGSTSKAAVPWMAFLREPACWAIFVDHFANNYGTYCLVSWAPSFIDDALGFDIENAGFISVAPYLAQFAVCVLGGKLADSLIQSGRMSLLQQRRLFGALGNMVPAVCLVFVALVDSASLAIVLLTIGVGMQGLSMCGGYSPNFLDVSPVHGSALFALSNTQATAAGIIAPALGGYLLGDDTKTASKEQWASVFWLCSVWFTFATVVWVRWVKVRPIAAINDGKSS